MAEANQIIRTLDPDAMRTTTAKHMLKRKRELNQIVNTHKVRLFHDGFVTSELLCNRAKCEECNSVIKNKKRGKYCSTECFKRSNNRNKEYRSRLKFKSAFIEKVSKKKVFESYNWTCAMCGIHTPVNLQGTLHPSSPTLDHIVPISKGGKHSYSNVQLLCRHCNCSVKQDKITE